MKAPRIQSYRAIDPRIYAYQTPGVDYHVGWTKIGGAYTQTVKERIDQQTKTAGLRWVLQWDRPARYTDGSGVDFKDHAFHAYLEYQQVERERDLETKRFNEWFRIDGEGSLKHFEVFARRGAEVPQAERHAYFLRAEQAEAVDLTHQAYERGEKAFLWNAKPRFGKTLTAYDLVRQMGWKRVLVLTNRPAIADSWANDFKKFIGWRGELLFISEVDTLKGRQDVYTREGYLKKLAAQAPEEEPYGFIAFVSLQDLKGAKRFGGRYAKLDWVAETVFDLVIVDEAHEGAETERAEVALDRIKHNFCLHLSGTPFKQLANNKFTPEQTYTWSYVDEQEAKANWQGESENPYASLPRMEMYTYQLSPMVETEVRKGFDDDHQYAFDLSEFFKTGKNGKFVYEEKVRVFLSALSTQKKYPFSTPELRRELKHTLWVLNRVASVKALESLLKEEGSLFKDYEIVIAAGDGKRIDEEEEIISEAALQRVRQAIASGKPTITLSVGQLTVGVTVPEWTGILMLNHLKSPAAYFQATFRVQNPHTYCEGDKHYMKEVAYVFDFDPTRTLELFEQFAAEVVPVPGGESGSPTERREARIRRLLNFYPVLGEDEDGEMIELDVAAVLAIPRKLKCQEVVKQGFMSNFLFQDIAGIFRNAKVYEGILNKIPVATEFHAKQKKAEPVSSEGVDVDEEGNVVVPPEVVVGTATELFGEKVYSYETEAQTAFDNVVTVISEREDETESYADSVVASVEETLVKVVQEVKEDVVAPATNGLKRNAINAIGRRVEAGLEATVKPLTQNYRQAMATAEAERDKALQTARTPDALLAVQRTYDAQVKAYTEAYRQKMSAATSAYVKEQPTHVVELAEKAKREEKKQDVESNIRSHLRGFTRTISSFLMAYGDESVTLANFDTYVPPEVFQEVTSITLEEFRLLRDGGEVNGEKVSGHIFDERVFNDAVQEFLQKRRKLADYLDPTQSEDIFNYIPHQKTNQVYTPREVVIQMVDALETENPECFNEPTKTFADLYAKSGLFIAEIAKRLYRSEAMKQHYPDDKARIKHIFTHQLYAMMPTEILYRIVMAYLFDRDPELREYAAPHFICADVIKQS